MIISPGQKGHFSALPEKACSSLKLESKYARAVWRWTSQKRLCHPLRKGMYTDALALAREATLPATAAGSREEWGERTHEAINVSDAHLCGKDDILQERQSYRCKHWRT